MGAMIRFDSLLPSCDFLRHLSDLSLKCICQMKYGLVCINMSVQGSGPVHLIGQHLLGALVEEFEDMEEMEEEMLDEEEGEDSQFKVSVECTNTVLLS